MDAQKKLIELVEMTIGQGASDLHLGAGNQPSLRVSGIMTPLIAEQPFTQEDMLAMLDVLLLPERKKAFLDTKEYDFSYSYGDKARFRGNAYFERGRIGVA